MALLGFFTQKANVLVSLLQVALQTFSYKEFPRAPIPAALLMRYV
jgi:hypothetical protein